MADVGFLPGSAILRLGVLDHLTIWVANLNDNVPPENASRKDRRATENASSVCLAAAKNYLRF